MPICLPQPSVVLPEVPLAEWSAIDTRTPMGLFAYRQVQATGLMDLPDFGGGDLDAQERREALCSAVALQKPLAALSLFLGVVALEDFVRDLVARMAEMPELLHHFPSLPNLRNQPRMRSPEQAFKRLDTDPAGVVDPEDINSVFQRALDVSPIPTHEYWHLRDLALIRHTVAHHGAVIRQVDIPRFRYFKVQPARLINPPPDFVSSELAYLFRVGRDAESVVRDAVFGRVLIEAGTGWSDRLPESVIRLIEFFAYFGYIESTTVTVGYSEPGSVLRQQQEAEAVRIHNSLVARCVADLIAKHGP